MVIWRTQSAYIDEGVGLMPCMTPGAWYRPKYSTDQQAEWWLCVQPTSEGAARWTVVC